MDYERVGYLRAHSAAWRMLRADTAPLVLAVLGRIFVLDNVRSIAEDDLVMRVDDELHAVNTALDDDSGRLAYPRTARDYVASWADPEQGWLRTFYPDGTTEAHYDATSDLEKAYAWVGSLEVRSFVGTESRLHTLIDLLRQIVLGADVDPASRIARLHAQRSTLDAEIALAESGQSPPLDRAGLLDRYQHFASTARELLADFREVEENFRALDRGAREDRGVGRRQGRAARSAGRRPARHRGVRPGAKLPGLPRLPALAPPPGRAERAARTPGRPRPDRGGPSAPARAPRLARRGRTHTADRAAAVGAAPPVPPRQGVAGEPPGHGPAALGRASGAPQPTTHQEIKAFRDDLRTCTDDALVDDDQYSEERFLRVKRIIERFRGREGQTDADRRWTQLVSDVRNWFVFATSERWRESGQEYEHYTDSDGKSGGQKEKLAYTILAASLAYQFRLEWGVSRSKDFRFAVIDEAFGRGSDVSTRYALELFRKLGLQLLIVTPLQKVHVIEPYVNAVGFVENRSGERSRLQTLTIEDFYRRREAHASAVAPVASRGSDGGANIR